jgi:hypothetical protein
VVIIAPSEPYFFGGFVVLGEGEGLEDGVLREVGVRNCPFAYLFFITGTEVVECCRTKKEAALLCVNEFNMFGARDGGKFFHDEGITLSLWFQPLVWMCFNM